MSHRYAVPGVEGEHGRLPHRFRDQERVVAIAGQGGEERVIVRKDRGHRETVVLQAHPVTRKGILRPGSMHHVDPHGMRHVGLGIHRPHRIDQNCCFWHNSPQGSCEWQAVPAMHVR